MKINIEVDITAEEMRKLMGMPDVAAFQQDLLDGIQEKMEAGVEGYDPMSLYQPFVANAFASMGAFQKFMSGAMKAYSEKQSNKE